MTRKESFWWDYSYYRAAGHSRLASFLNAVAEMLVDEYQYTICKLKGHRWEAEADAENGTEDVMCTRCGESHHYQF